MYIRNSHKEHEIDTKIYGHIEVNLYILKKEKNYHA